MTGGEIAGWGYVFIVLAAVALVIAWIVLPFAIIGTKPLLSRLLEEQKRTNRLLEALTPPAAPPRATTPSPSSAEPAYLRDDRPGLWGWLNKPR